MVPMTDSISAEIFNINIKTSTGLLHTFYCSLEDCIHFIVFLKTEEIPDVWIKEYLMPRKGVLEGCEN